METISIRLDEGMMNKLNSLMRKYHFATLTEFIREAIRNRIKELEQEELQKQIVRLSGSSKRKTTEEQLHEAGKNAFEKLERKFKI